jgi:hypothetical protein
MTQQNPFLPAGYSPLPPGHLANLVLNLVRISRSFYLLEVVPKFYPAVSAL